MMAIAAVLAALSHLLRMCALVRQGQNHHDAEASGCQELHAHRSQCTDRLLIFRLLCRAGKGKSTGVYNRWAAKSNMRIAAPGEAEDPRAKHRAGDLSGR